MSDKKTRNTLWLKVGNEVNTLRRHMINAGYRAGYETTIAKQQKCKPSEIPLEVLSFYLNGKPEVVDMPGDWQTIIYGSRRGAQKNRKIGSRISGKAMVDVNMSERVTEFLTMRLSQNPVSYAAYY